MRPSLRTCGTAQLGPITARSRHDVPDTRCSVPGDHDTRTGRPRIRLAAVCRPAASKRRRRPRRRPAEATAGQAEDRGQAALGLNDVVVRRLLTAGQDLQAALGLLGDHPASGKIRHAVDEMDQAIRDIRDTTSITRRVSSPPRHIHEHDLNQESRTSRHGEIRAGLRPRNHHQRRAGRYPGGLERADGSL